MPAGTVAGEVEQHLRAQARKKKLKGRRADKYVYGALNNRGLMHGNQVTDSGMRQAGVASRARRSARSY